MGWVWFALAAWCDMAVYYSSGKLHDVNCNATGCTGSW